MYASLTYFFARYLAFIFGYFNKTIIRRFHLYFITLSINS